MAIVVGVVLVAGMPAVAVAAVTSNVTAAGILTVTSDADSDSIDIFCDGAAFVKIQVNGGPPADPDSGAVLCADITAIVVNGGGGDDSISLNGVTAADFAGLTGPVVVNAGDGDDFVNGSPQDDDINGGDGNDFLQGGQGGTDSLDGEGGGDTSYLQIDPAVTQAVTANDTGAGPDDQDMAQVDGSAAGDTITVTDTVFTAGLQTMTFSGMERRSVNGNEGDDTLDASANTSGVELEGGLDNDTLTGGSGEDFLSDNGGGNGTMNGGAGRDQLNVSGPGSKTLDGQADGDNYNVNFDPATAVTVDDSGAPPLPPPCPGCGSDEDDHLSGNGTSAGETINVTNLTMTLGGGGTISYPLGGGLEQLNADGHGGDDVLDASAVTDKRVSLVGKGGEDTLTGGALADSLNGDDWPCFPDFGGCPIPVFPERDVVNGGAGNDQLMSAGGEDALGNLDALDGQEGDDNYQVALGPPELELVDNPATFHSYGWVGAETWAEAEQTAADWGGHLLTLNDAAEETWVVGQFGTDPLAIGFNDIAVEGTFVWTSGDPVTYTNWCPNEPNDLPPGEDVAVMNAEVGGGSPECWNDVPEAGGGVAEFAGAVLAPTAGADVNDTGAGGFDTLDAQGTSGNDTIVLTDIDITLGANVVSFSGIEQPGASGLGGNDTVDASAVNPLNVRLNGNAGDDNLFGGAGDDSLTGDDFFFGCEFCPPPPPPGNDTMNGNGGNDTMNGNGGNDSYDGGDGSDNSQVQLGLAGASTVTDSGPPPPPCPPCGPGDSLNANGTPGDDVIFGDGASYWIAGLGSVAYDGFIEFADASGQDGNDTMDGTASPAGTSVRFRGNGGNDILIGGDGNDDLTGDDFFFGCPFCPPPPPAGDDTITGGAGDDYLFFRGGTDTGDGEEGNDRTEIRLPGGGNTTVTDSGLGTDEDQITFQGEDANDTITITATTGSDGVGLVTFSGQETVNAFGNGGDDTINASAATVYTNLNGGNDDDTLIGSPGNDNLSGDGCCGDGGPYTPGNDVLNGGQGADNLWGDEGDDTLDGGFGGDWLEGGAGVDTVTYATRFAGVNVTIGSVCPPACGPPNDGQPGEGDNVQASVENVTGGLGPDNLTGSASANELNGGGGNDVLDGGLGADILIGGAGTDTVTYGPRIVGVNASLDNAANDGQPGELDNIGPAGDVENLTGGSGADTLTGNAQINLLNGNSGADILNGGALGDTLKGGGGADILNGDEGNDILDGQAGPDTFNGGPGMDKADYASRTTAVTVTLAVGADDGTAGEGDNVGPTGDMENVTGGTAGDTITGDANANLLVGGAGNDVLSGLSLNDTLTGQQGNDTLNGGAGDDVLDGGLGDDVFNGGGGTNDVAYYAARPQALNLSIDGVANDGAAGENDNVGLDVENLTGGTASDTLTGDADANILIGGSGADTLNGGGGGDSLNGGDGADILNGDAGIDTLIGGLGPDTFNGGAGVADKADYGTVAVPLTITIDGVANDGTGGGAEGDNVGLDVEQVQGGLGNDTITGSAFPNSLFGGAGNDILDGLGDVDQLFGGPGDDDLFSNDGTPGDTNNCGPDADEATPDAAGDTTAGDCETIH